MTDKPIDPLEMLELLEDPDYTARVIPTPDDHDRWAQSRIPIDMIVQGRSTSLFQASQQWSRMSS